VLVVDSSAVLAVLFGEAGAPQVERALASAAVGTVRAPEFLALEVSNVVVSARRKARKLRLAAEPNSLIGCPGDRLAGLLRGRIEALGISLEPASGAVGFDRLCAIADACGLTTYDALYLASAEHRGAALLTLDEALVAAAPSVGIRLALP
jgi:predicted nucleic acid-binding protein